MHDYLTTFEQFKSTKEIADLIDDVKKLRLYYSTQQYDKMQRHIRSLTAKYMLETIAWNSTHQNYADNSAAVLFQCGNLFAVERHLCAAPEGHKNTGTAIS